MKSVIIGAGTYGEVYLAYLQEAGIDVIGFLDDNIELQGKTIGGEPVLGGISDLSHLKSDLGVEAVYCPLGNNKLRVSVLKHAKSLGYKIPNYIHPSVIISPKVTIGEGVYILPGSTILPHTRLADFVMISTNACVVHHSTLDEGVFISNGCNFGASIHAKRFAYCGMGCTIMTGVQELGEDCLIGAGAVVIKDVPDFAVMAGVPAKILKYHNIPNNSDLYLMGGGN